MIVNYNARKIQGKIVVYGPENSEKTQLIKSLFKILGKENEIKTVESLAGRTLYFDFGTLKFKGKENWDIEIIIGNANVESFYAKTRPAALQGADCLIYLASELGEYANQLDELKTFYRDGIGSINLIFCLNKAFAEATIDQLADFGETDDFHNFVPIKIDPDNNFGTREVFETAIGFLFPSTMIKLPILEGAK